MQYDVQDTVKDSKDAAWLISGVVGMHTKNILQEASSSSSSSSELIRTCKTASMQHQLQGMHPKLRQTRYCPGPKNVQSCTLRGIVAAMLSCQQSSSFIQLVCRKSLRVRSCSYARSHSGSVGVPNAMMADHLTAVLQAFTFMAAGPHRRSRLQLHRLS